MCFHGNVLGVRAGGLAFNLREPVVLGPIKVRDVKVMFSSDLLAMALFIGMEGQASHDCPYCRGNPRDFKRAAGHDKAVLPQRTAATQAEDCAAYCCLAPGSSDPHVNGVHAEPLLPIDWDLLIPPWLHLPRHGQ